MAGRPKPSYLKIATGNPGKRKINKSEPLPESPLPEPPGHLDDYAREEWHRIASGLHALKLLFSVDTGAFAAYCEAYSIWRSCRELLREYSEQSGSKLSGLISTTTNGNKMQHPLLGIANVAKRDMIKAAQEFGLTPQARARIGSQVIAPKESKFDGLIGHKRQK